MTAERLLKLKAKSWRIILASFIGALFSMSVFIDLRSFLFSAAIKLAATVAVCVVAFRFHSFKELCKYIILTLGVSFVFSGMMIAVYRIFQPPNMIIINDVVYFDVHPLLLLGLTGVIYMLVYLMERLLRERLRASVVRLAFTVGATSCQCIAKIDTGCCLTEPFSGAPVIVADESVFTLPDEAERRVIPYSTVGSSSLLYAVRASTVAINDKVIDKPVYIAQGSIRNSAYQAIIHSDLLR